MDVLILVLVAIVMFVVAQIRADSESDDPAEKRDEHEASRTDAEGPVS